jgi:2-hydroxycyclohexanecarboxyl-CoA dehydrogenase
MLEDSYMDLHLTGQTAVIAGGARGIGLAIAREFAKEGAGVAILDRDKEATAAAQAIARDHRAQTEAWVVNVTDFAATATAAQQILKRFGRIDHVVFAVGIGSGKFGFPFWNLEPADWPRVMEINVQGAVHVLHAFTPILVKAGSGTMLLIASVAGQIGSQTDPPYSASKAALINFAQCAAKDLAPHNVRVNTLCPGMVKTILNQAVWESWNRQQPPAQRRSYEDWAADKINKMVPLGRWQEPEDMAAMAVFLASDRAKNITGQTVNVDGGFVMHW